MNTAEIVSVLSSTIIDGHSPGAVATKQLLLSLASIWKGDFSKAASQQAAIENLLTALQDPTEEMISSLGVADRQLLWSVVNTLKKM